MRFRMKSGPIVLTIDIDDQKLLTRVHKSDRHSSIQSLQKYFEGLSRALVNDLGSITSDPEMFPAFMELLIAKIKEAALAQMSYQDQAASGRSPVNILEEVLEKTKEMTGPFLTFIEYELDMNDDPEDM
jgi:hypothetical protein